MLKISNQRVRYLPHQEADELLGAVRKRSQQVWEYGLLSLHTGVRTDECLSLLWGHVDFDQGLIHVADPKGGPPRDVYMSYVMTHDEALALYNAEATVPESTFSILPIKSQSSYLLSRSKR